MRTAVTPVAFQADFFTLHAAATALGTAVAAIEASHLARAGRPASLALGIALLTPIAADIAKLADSCRLAATNYEQVENSLVPAFLRGQQSTMAALAVATAAGLSAAASAVGLGETPVVPVPAGSSNGAAPANLQALLGTLNRASVSQEILVQVSERAEGRAFTLYLPGTNSWSPVPKTSAFDLTSDLAAMAGPGKSAPERAAIQALTQSGFGQRQGDTVAVVGYSEGGLAGANLVASGELTGLGGKVTNLVAVGSPISARPIPNGVNVLSLEHSNDPVPKLDLAEHRSNPSWKTIRLGSSGLLGHSLEGYRASLNGLRKGQLATINRELAAVFGEGTTKVNAYRAVRVSG